VTRVPSPLASLLRRAAAAAAIAAFSLLGLRAQTPPDYERPPIHYSRTAPQDAIAQLLARLSRHELTLASTPTASDLDILRAVLRELKIPTQSQLLVFSRTSLQAALIRPDTPRALYFSDSAYIGWIPGGLIEVAALDPHLGPVFYAFDPQDARDARRTFVRENSCLRCHGTSPTREIPGLFARSIFTAANGEPLLRHGSTLVDDTTPFADRWGGWYVSGYTGTQPHRGNAFARERAAQLDFTPSDLRPADLSTTLDTSRYLAATSDVVALLIFEHQLAMHNSLTRANHRARRLLADPSTASASVPHALASIAEDVLDHLLFRHAAPLPAGVRGRDDFRRAFAADAPRSPAGHTLKDLAPTDRLFAHRCSFLIYSDSFAALPAPLKDRVLDRLGAVLGDTDTSGRYAYLETEEKRRILAILTATHPEARRHFQTSLN
jgi:hypothetical protein